MNEKNLSFQDIIHIIFMIKNNNYIKQTVFKNKLRLFEIMSEDT